MWLFLMCLCFSDQFRRRDTTQTGNASFQYDDVSFLQLTCFFFVWRVRFSAAFSCVKINTEFIILSLNAGRYLIWNLCRVCINSVMLLVWKADKKQAFLQKQSSWVGNKTHELLYPIIQRELEMKTPRLETNFR